MTFSYNNTLLMQDMDRLVDGELSPLDRQNLLKRLDNEPDGWRRCALAFLEDQAFREGLKPVAQEVPAALTLPKSQPRSRRRDRLMTAAAVLLAFTLGWSAKRQPAASPAVVVTAEKPIPAAVPEVLKITAPSPARLDPDPEIERKRAWERAGFEFQRLNRFVAVDTKDGRRVAMPVSEYSVQYIGDRTY